MGVIVAAPTAGSCGAMPGSVLAVADSLGIDEDGKVRALLEAGLIGVFIATRWVHGRVWVGSWNGGGFHGGVSQWFAKTAT